ncbi:MAG TPA: VOC family protein [Rhizomicrobium sp.]
MTKAIPISAKTMTFVITRDRAVAKKFYGEVLGFKFVSEDDFAAVFDLNGTMLRMSTLKGFQPQQHTVLGWDVPDIVASVTALNAKGVTFNIYEGFGQDKLGIWKRRAVERKSLGFRIPMAMFSA